MPRPPGMGRPRTQPSKAPEDLSNSERQVWVLENGQPQAVKISTGITDGKMTEVVSGDLQADMAVIVGSSSTSGGKP